MSGSSKPLTDTKLFKMAFSSEQRDLKKRDAQIAALKAKAARHAADAVDGLPHSQHAQLSDAKLFADALREQHELHLSRFALEKLRERVPRVLRHIREPQ